MSEGDGEPDWDEEIGEDEESGCDYGVAEFCSDPFTKEQGLCTTECSEYLASLEKPKQEEIKHE